MLSKISCGSISDDNFICTYRRQGQKVLVGGTHFCPWVMVEFVFWKSYICYIIIDVDRQGSKFLINTLSSYLISLQ